MLSVFRLRVLDMGYVQHQYQVGLSLIWIGLGLMWGIFRIGIK